MISHRNFAILIGLLVPMAAYPNAFTYSNGIYQVLPLDLGAIALGVNDSGQIVGEVGSAGFLLTDGTTTPINYSGGSSTQPFGISNNGQFIVGGYDDSKYSFLYSNGVFTTLNLPYTYPVGPNSTAFGVNDAGDVVGFFTDDTYRQHGYLYANGVYTTINVPGALNTFAEGINDKGEIAGYYQDGTGYHGFLDQDGAFSSIDGVCSHGSFVTGINNEGSLTGYCQSDSFLYQNGVVTSLNVPGADSTWASGINDSGEVVGWFDLPATPPPPVVPTPETGSAALFGVGLVALAVRNSRT
jgi:probable HAF family extracellular repeat protein